MSPVEIAAEALGIDASAIESVTLLRDGLTNDSWLIRAQHESVVVRINNPRAETLQLDRHAETEILALVAAAGIGAEVLICDPVRQLLVTRYCGPTCTEEELRSPERVGQLGGVLGRLHALPPPAIPRVHWPEVIHRYVGTLTTMNVSTPLLEGSLMARATALAQELEKTAGPLTLCHNDVHYMNIVAAEERMRLIDWEYAGLGDPYFDLASVAVYGHFSLKERAILLQGYLGEVTGDSLQRLAKACFVFEYVHDLWHEVRQRMDDVKADDAQ